MAKRPVFVPCFDGEYLVKTQMVEFTYHAGFALSQKQKCIDELHQSFVQKHGNHHVLEISSKSKVVLGQSLSAFNLMITDPSRKRFSVECAFQASKVFEYGGAYLDLLDVSSRDAKKDERLKTSGRLLEFRFLEEQVWSLEPKTAFYDWLYINALNQNTQLHSELLAYNAFTDIEFNPEKSINCQAYSAALFVALYHRDMLNVIKEPDEFLALYQNFKLSNAVSLNKAKKQSS